MALLHSSEVLVHRSAWRLALLTCFSLQVLLKPVVMFVIIE